MSKKRADQFAKQLAQYGALSAIMAAGTNADGQIIYTDENPDFVGGSTSQYLLDLNNDGEEDFRIFGLVYGNANALAVQPLGSSTNANGVMGGAGSSSSYALALLDGQAIDNTGNFYFPSSSSSIGAIMNVQYPGNCYGEWCNEANKFLGLTFKIAGVTHFGWARMSANAENEIWVLKDYAYESAAGVGIAAGAVPMVATEETNIDNSVDFFPNPTTGQLTLRRTNNADLLSAEIMDVNGTVLKRIDLTQTPLTTTLSMEGFASGMYFIRVNTSEASGVKKIVKE